MHTTTSWRASPTYQNSQTDAGKPLRLIGPDLSNRVCHLLARPAGFRPLQRCSGFYMLDESARTLFPNDAFSLTALSDGQEESGDVDHARTGANIWVEITGVKGSAGAKFGFWDRGRSAAYDTPSNSFPTNEDTGNHAFVVSRGYDASDEDPHGHFHGRAWTADMPVDYFVTADSARGTAFGIPIMPAFSLYSGLLSIGSAD